METTASVESAFAEGVRPLTIDIPDEEIEDLRTRLDATRWPSKELVADARQGVQLATTQELTRYWAQRLRLAHDRGEAERAAAVHDRDRRARHPLHPRQVAARERAAADHHARLARLGHRDARGHRPAHGPDRARRTRRGRVRPRAAVAARLRLLRPADGGRLGPGPHRASLGGADEPPRLHPLRRPGRRPGRHRHRRDGTPGPGRAARHPPQLPQRLPDRGGGGDLRRRPAGLFKRVAIAVLAARAEKEPRRSMRSRRTSRGATSSRCPSTRRRSATP